MSRPVTASSWSGRHLQVTVLHSSAGVASQILVAASREILLVDCGDGTLSDLLASRIDPRAITAVLITHGHFDHSGGLFSLLGFMRMVGRSTRLPILAPEGSIELVALLRAFHTSYPDSVPFPIERVAAVDRRPILLGPFSITPVAVIHSGSVQDDVIQDQIPATGYRIVADGETVAVTGDTGLCDSLRDLVTGADLALVEATFDDDAKVSPEMFRRVHLSEKLARQVGEMAREFMLVHCGFKPRP